MTTFVRGIAAACLLAAAIGLPAAGARVPDQAKKPSGPIQVQLLAINDFHGNLEPPSGSSGRIGTTTAGGAEYLATHIRALEATNPFTVVVSAGDLIGASPLLSALFHDEPTIEAMNEIGLDLNAVGNHEFDDGADELLRMQNGGCHPVDGCRDGDAFGGAAFKFLAANVVRKDNGRTLFAPYQIRSFSGVKVAFIGMTLEGTPQIVTPSGIANLEFKDEADTVNALVPELKGKGVESIIVLLHEGGIPTGGYNECPGISGPIVDIAERMDDEVDAIISGHTHQGYNCVIDGTVVTSASSFGRLVTDIDLSIDRVTGDVTQVAANNVIVTRDVARDAPITALIERYRELAAPYANRVIGSITTDVLRAQNSAGESSLGDVIADAQLFATAPADLGGAVAAFMNPGGIRADLIYAQTKGEAPGEVTYEEAFTVQPFGNNLVTMSLTGAQIEALLEQQWTSGSGRILQVSNGFSYVWDASRPPGDRVDPSSIWLNGVTIDPNASYRVTVNSFLADGGDGFTVLTHGTNRLGGVVDLDALEQYLRAFSPVSPGPMDRIIRVG
ncbi:MAG TPA: bifunctional metallophosphatase/5'-nucleotidase [Actinomycetota bacterium]|jgi:5'-nucleotidase|nr:bifunctional metallophosphatase/5'-nucleotidase [Actinomycetota bacterium]